ncbi:mycothiol maleylpyruvate isomerase [Nocardioides albidus]|uniref:Mycothiol maleylpyruvate isomerase n=1 Tax=Nocardioides albidus TaxID=1517589 RepID=A0A5C4WJF4_9ACTN|nr:maleylpyruvate isomerase N-terminal domain-containing protein [Nocardioides albidus]TNM48287.1 mycothiol maleylpyruvate isomerase [Nocardioides albidus]
MTTSPDQTFLQAAEMFAALCDRIAEPDWTRPGLGEWDVRALVGHTLRAVTTVHQYLSKPHPSAPTCGSTGEYFALARSIPGADSRAVAERGHQAGRDLGPRPVDTIRAEIARTRTSLEETVDDGAGLDTVVETVVGAMRLSDYLPTRTFELTAHSIDLATACALALEPPASVIESAVQTAASALTHSSDGVVVLRHLIGRPAEGFRPLFD